VIAWYQSKESGGRLATKHSRSATNIANKLILANYWDLSHISCKSFWDGNLWRVGPCSGCFMKQRSRAHKGYPSWRQRESRMLIWALTVGSVAAAVAGLLVWLVSRNGNGY